LRRPSKSRTTTSLPERRTRHAALLPAAALLLGPARVIPEVWKIGRAAELGRRLQQATIWVADDTLRTRLRIRSEVFIGAVTLDLVKIEA
jgi:hypothetical protein